MTVSPSPSPRWGMATKLVVALATLALVGMILYRFQQLIPPLVVALMAAYLLNPPVAWISARLGLGRGWAVGVVYLALLLVFAGLSTALGVTIRNQLSTLHVDNLLTMLSDLPHRLAELTSQTVQVGGFPIDLSQFDFTPIYDQILETIRPALTQTGALIGSVASAAFSTAGWVVFILVVAYYLLLDSQRWHAVVERLAFPGYEHDFRRLAHELGLIWNAFLRGQAVLALIMGVVVGVTMTFLGLNNALLVGALAGVLEFIPLIGPFIAGAVAVLLALFQTSNYLGLSPLAYAILIVVASLLLQQLENNFLVPRILGQHLNLHPVAVLVAAVMGASLAGILGLLLSAPVFATARLLARYAYCKMFDLDPWATPTPPPEHRPLFRMPLPRLGKRKPPAS